MARSGHGPDILVVMNDFRAPAGVLGEGILAHPGFYLSVAPGVGYSALAPDRECALPESDAGFDGLVVLGGPQTATDDVGNPHFRPLLALIRRYHAADKPILGVCLGGQLIARAFEARVYDQGGFDFGFMPVRLTEAGKRDALFQGFASELPLMQSHRDTFEVPEGGVLLAVDGRGGNQGFRLGRATYALQFHPEVTVDIAREWARKRADQLRAMDAGYVARFEAQIREHMRGANRLCRTLAARWLDLARAPI